jgi:hypothetical protein
MKRYIITASLLLSMVLPASAQVPDNGRQQIEGVVEAFRTAIMNKEKRPHGSRPSRNAAAT